MIEKYLKMIEEFSQKIKGSKLSTMEYFEKMVSENDRDIITLIELQEIFMTSQDTAKVIGYSPIGYFRNLEENKRLAAFYACLEIEKVNTNTDLSELCKLYSEEKPLFQNSNLWKHIRKKDNGTPDCELLDLEFIDSINDSEVVSIENGYSKINAFLNPHIVWWSKKNFTTSKIFVRLDQDKYYQAQPLQSINEEVLIPANPDWWQQLKIYKGSREGSSYFLEDPKTPKNNELKFWEYHVKNIRNLQVSAKRNNSGNFSIMIEELNEYYLSSGLLMGKCIHLDSDAIVGSDINNVTLNHLDLAIQFYENDSIEKRRQNDLSRGMVESATFRTHLFRIENIPIKALFFYALMFLDSKVLLKEWINDQFKE